MLSAKGLPDTSYHLAYYGLVVDYLLAYRSLPERLGPTANSGIDAQRLCEAAVDNPLRPVRFTQIRLYEVAAHSKQRHCDFAEKVQELNHLRCWKKAYHGSLKIERRRHVVLSACPKANPNSGATYTEVLRF